MHDDDVSALKSACYILYERLETNWSGPPARNFFKNFLRSFKIFLKFSELYKNKRQNQNHGQIIENLGQKSSKFLV